MAKEDNQLLSKNIDQVFGDNTSKMIKNSSKGTVRGVKINLKPSQFLEKRELLGISEIMMVWNFTDLCIKKQGKSLGIEFTA